MPTKSKALCVTLNGKKIGEIRGETFICKRTASRHMLRTPLAWCFDADIWDNLTLPSCTKLRIEDISIGRFWEMSMTDFILHRGTIDRGYGRQYFVILRWWTVGEL